MLLVADSEDLLEHHLGSFVSSAMVIYDFHRLLVKIKELLACHLLEAFESVQGFSYSHAGFEPHEQLGCGLVALDELLQSGMK